MAIDEVRALQLLDGNHELLRQLAGIFAEDSIQLVNDFDQAVAVGDALQAGRAIHSLKGITATFCAETEVNLFALVEQAAFLADWSRLEPAREEVKEAVAAVVREMRERSWLIVA
jgi:HPt (histidine-containing phosphotransfer) domain-containing protein